MPASLWNLIDQLCQPSPALFENSIQRDIVFKRNKSVLFFQVIGCAMFTLYNLTSHTPANAVQIANMFIFISSTLVFLICCRSYRTLFKIFYFLLTAFYAPFLHFYCPDGVFFNFVGASVLPVWILCLSDSKLLFVAQVLIQSIWLHFFSESQLIATLEQVSTTDFAHKMMQVMIIGTILNSLFILAIKLALDRAHSEISISKVKVKDLQRQKTSILEFSHELRNLVNTITNTGKLCVLEGVSTRVRELLTSSQICGDLIVHLVNNVLDAGKTEIGELEVVPKISLVSHLLENIWSVSSQLINSRKLQGQIKIYKRVPPALKLDNHRMIQILVNLVMNAIKFTEKGSIRITVDWIENKDNVDDKCFEPMPFNDMDEGIFEKDEALSLLRGDAFIFSTNQPKINMDTGLYGRNLQQGVLKVMVTDTGCGISSDNISKLFTKFTQVNDDQTLNSKGSGLGLFITKQLVQKMQGKIQAFSTVGKGSAFIACIPMEAMQLTKTEVLELL